MKFGILGSVAFVLTAGSAVAQSVCATAQDVARGLHIDFVDGTTETYRSTGPGVMTVDGFDGGELYFRLEIAQGTHLLSYVAIADGVPDPSSRQSYDYGMTASELPVPSDGGRFNPTVFVEGSDGRRPEDQFQAYVSGDPLTLEGCTYETLDVLIAYDTADNYMESIRYFPALGVGYLLWNQSDEGRSDDNVVSALRIEAAGK